jgi:hypothetical protein
MERMPIDDDDLIVDLDDLPENYGAQDDEALADFSQPDLEAPTLPDADEESPAPAARTREAPASFADADLEADTRLAEQNDRVQAAERKVREVEANSVMIQARAQAAIADKDRSATKVALDSLDLRMRDARQKLRVARDNGHVDAEEQLTDALEEMKALKGQVEAAMNAIPDPKDIIAHGETRSRQLLSADPGATGKTVGSGIQAKHPLAERWAGSNGWMKSNTAANRFVISQSNLMVKNGEWDPNTPGFYAELGRRVQNAFPSIKVGSIQAQKRGPSASGMKTPVAPSRSATATSNASRGAQKSRYTLTASDQAAMSRAKLDPSNPKHRLAFAQARMESAARLGR